MFPPLMDNIYFRYSRNLMLSFNLSKSPFMKALSASVSTSLHGTFRLCVCVGDLKLSSLSSDLAGREVNIGLAFRLY